MKGRPKPKTGEILQGYRDLAAELGVSHVQVGKYIEMAGWPFGKSNWLRREVPAIKSWLASNLSRANEKREETDPSKLSVMNKAKLKKMLEETSTIQIRNKILNGEYVSKEESDKDHCEKLNRIMRDMMALPNASPFDEQIKNWFRTQIREYFVRLST